MIGKANTDKLWHWGVEHFNTPEETEHAVEKLVVSDLDDNDLGTVTHDGAQYRIRITATIIPV